MPLALQKLGQQRASSFSIRRHPSRNAFGCKPKRTTRMQVRAATDLDPDNATIVVAGGGGVALSVTRKLKDMGSWVYMLQRHDGRRAEIEKMMAFVVKGDALNKDQVEKIFDGIEEVDAVVCTIGGTTKEPQVDSTGNINIIEAAVNKGAKKFVLVTSIGCGDSKDATGPEVYKALEPVLVEKNKAEERLKELGDKMAYTIIRPGGLQTAEATGDGFLTADNSVCGAITREDVATLVVKALFSPATDNKVLSALDKKKLFNNATAEEFKL